MGSDPNQVVKAFNEAENYNGPALIIAYSHCVAHGIDMSKGLETQKNAVASGHWPLFRYNPDSLLEGKNPLKLDSKEPSMSIKDYVYGETRYSMLKKINPEESAKLIEQADHEAKYKYELLKKMSEN